MTADSEMFMQACPPGELVVTEFDYDILGAIEDDEIQCFHGPRDDVADEFDTEFEMWLFVKGTLDGEAFEVRLHLDVYQDMDVGDDKVHFETKWRTSYALFPLEFGDAVLALCEGIPSAAYDEVMSHCDSVRSAHDK